MFHIDYHTSPVNPTPTGPDDVQVTITRLEQAHRKFTTREISNMRWTAAWCMGEAKASLAAGDQDTCDRYIEEAHRLLELSGIPVSPLHA